MLVFCHDIFVGVYPTCLHINPRGPSCVVLFIGSASPEGGAAYNKQLAASRMSVLEKYVRERVTIPDGIVTRKVNGIAWVLLSELVTESDMPDKATVLCVIRDVPEAVFDKNGRSVDSRKKQLMDLRWGRTWN